MKNRYDGKRVGRIDDSRRMRKTHNGQKTARLGTNRNPASVKAQTEERKKELQSVFEKHGWEHKIELRPDEPEEITDLEMLLNPAEPVIAEKDVGRNSPCPCGSGKKYKKCCGW